MPWWPGQLRDVAASATRAFPRLAVCRRGELRRSGDRRPARGDLQTFYYTDALARDAGRLELYDVRSDPEERDDAAAREPAVVARLDAALEAWREAHATAARGLPASIPPERERDLRALGYVE